MMAEPRVTILMPVHNEVDYLAEAIDSVRAQDFDAWRLWVLDDASTDGSRALAEKAAAEDPRIEVRPNAENLGRTRTLNRALADVETELCARHDGDDRSAPQRLGLQVALMDQHPDVGLVSAWMRMMDTGGRALRVWEVPTEPADLAREMRLRNCICHGAAMFRTALARDLGGYREAFRYAEDYDLWLRMLERTSLRILGQPLYDYRMHAEADSQSRNYEQHCEVALIHELARERDGGGEDALQRAPDEVAQQLAARFTDAGAKLAYYQQQHDDAKRYIAELEEYRDDLLRQLRAGSGGDGRRSVGSRLRAAWRGWRG